MIILGDTICIPYHSGKKFHLDVRDVQPNGAASIIETDCNVDFEEPLGYKVSCTTFYIFHTIIIIIMIL